MNSTNLSFRITLSMLALVGCTAGKSIVPLMECQPYLAYINNERSYQELVNWADREVFPREFVAEDFGVGGLVGPGRWGAIAAARAKITVPDYLKELELRAMGRDRFHPDGLFIGRSSFRGVIIARTNMDDLLQASRMTRDGLHAERDRVAVVCEPLR